MFTQFFGNFLLKKEVVNKDQLIHGLSEQSNARIKLGTLAIHSGLMAASDVEKVIILQKRYDLRFGDLAVQEGYLTNEQVDELLERQVPEYLTLGQIFIDQGIITNQEFETLLNEYQRTNGLADLDMMDEQLPKIRLLIKNFCDSNDIHLEEESTEYLVLLFNCLIRFIGDDFTPLSVIEMTDYPIGHGASQELHGKIDILSAIDTTTEVAQSFASRYARFEFNQYDEYVSASMEDFLNLMNGLYSVNMSNKFGIELELAPPIQHTNDLLKPQGTTFLLPILYPFGTIHFIISILN